MISFFIIAHVTAVLYHYTNEAGFAGITQCGFFQGQEARTGSRETGVFFTDLTPPSDVADRQILLNKIYAGTAYAEKTSRCEYVIAINDPALENKVRKVRDHVYVVETSKLKVPAKHEWSRLDVKREGIMPTNLTRESEMIEHTKNNPSTLFLKYDTIRNKHDMLKQERLGPNRDQQYKHMLEKTMKITYCMNASDREYVLNRLCSQFNKLYETNKENWEKNRKR